MAATIYRYPAEIIDPSTDYLKIDVLKYVAGGNVGSGVTVFTTGNLTSTTSQSLDTSLYLPIPSNIQDGNGVNWGENELNSFTAYGVNVAEGLMDSKPTEILDKVLTTIQNTTNLAVKESGLIRKALAAEAVSVFGGNISINSLLARETGQILNPNMELLFNGVTLRTFRFSFKMTPRDPDERDQVKNIIRTLKKNMSAKKGGDIYLNTPNIFKLSYMKGGSPHPFLHKFQKDGCALKDMSVNYTGENVYATYSDGTPVSIMMDLTFQELFPIYNEDYDTPEGKAGVGY